MLLMKPKVFLTPVLNFRIEIIDLMAEASVENLLIISP
jgi:hypothetical protein